jgi:hypothetical protein
MVAGVIVALNNGNVGTLVRFRDTIIPFLIWPSGLGIVATLSRLMTRARETTIVADAVVALPRARLG